jgi:malate synthase
MEDLATDRIYRLMIAQRVKHKVKVAGDDRRVVEHTAQLVTQLFDEELAKIKRDLPAEIDRSAAETLPESRRIAEGLIVQGQHSPV